MSKAIINQFIKESLDKDFSDLEDLEDFKRVFSKNKEDFFPSNADIKKAYHQMVAAKEIQPKKQFEDLLIARKIRTLSGVAVIAVLTKPYPCPGKCIFCPTEDRMPKSYLSNEPAVMRAIMNEFNPYRQVQSRIRALQHNGHPTDKLELIVLGGTFSAFPTKYKKWYLKECFRAANDFPLKIKSSKKDLAYEKKRNEKAKNRIIGETLETRPDHINQAEIALFRELGATRVEMGVQSVFDDVLRANRRGHLIRHTAEATKLLKDAGFKVSHHLMPGLHTSTPKKDVEMFRIAYSDPRFQPDMVKVYPCVVNEHAELFKLWQAGKYKPLSNDLNAELMVKIKEITPQYVRISRLIRDIPNESIQAGPDITNLRQILQQKGVKCQCIRCREVGKEFFDTDKIILDRIDYEASGGQEVFLQFVSKDKQKLYAMLRLRLPNKQESKVHFLRELRNCALIREVHTYGKMTKIKSKDKKSPQHIGLGKRLMKEAERIAKEEFGFQKMAVISGVGVREYYRKNGYRLSGEYMVKKIG